MLPSSVPFPCPGSTGFERGTGRKLTVIQLRGDGRALTRREDEVRPGETVSGSARGNFTLALADICETFADSLKKTRTNKRRARK